MRLNISTLKVGDKVGIYRSGSWTIHSEGIYAVKKVNKVRIILGRESDGYEREFSARTGLEKGSERYRSASLETVQEQMDRKLGEQQKRAENAAWEQVETAAKRKDLAALRATVAALEAREWLNG